MQEINKFREESAATLETAYNNYHSTETRIKRDSFVLTNLDCADCAAKLEKQINRIKGVHSAKVNFATSTLYVEHTASVKKILLHINNLGYKVGNSEDKDNKKLILTASSGLFLLMGVICSFLKLNTMEYLFYMIGIMTGIYLPVKAAYFSLKNGLSFDMNVLMTVAVVGAIFIGETLEAATVVFLFSLGNLLEEYSMQKTRNSIRNLMELAPKKASVQREGRIEAVPVEEIKVGDTVIIRPGEKIPIDGKVIWGETDVNEASITGEWLPVAKGKNDEVFAGTVNGEGSIRVKATKSFYDTTLAKIIEQVEKAQEKKAPVQRYVDVFAGYYTPAVIISALLVVFIPTVFFDSPFQKWFYRGLTLLVVSCPCAFVISTPVAIVSAIGNAAKNGVLIKGGAFLEAAGKLKAIAFDKTGTLTSGEPKIAGVIPLTGDEEQLLRIAAAVESFSEHPIAKAVQKYVEEREIKLPEVENFSSLPGKGAKGTINGKEYYVAKPDLFINELKPGEKFLKEKVSRLQGEGKTVILVGSKDAVLGAILIEDNLRKHVAKVINKIKAAGIKTVMLTGDNSNTASIAARSLKIDEYRANLLPEQKVNYIKELEKKYGTVAMVGDGINDSPALATANVGIAMGGTGTDSALETADIVLMADDLKRLPFTINLSNKARKIIMQNIVFSLLVKLLAVLLIFPGILNLWLAILADTGASLIVILNGMRLLKVKPDV